MDNQWETIEARVKRHARIPLKKKMEWLRDMLEFSSRHNLKLRRKLRSLSRWRKALRQKRRAFLLITAFNAAMVLLT